MSTPARPERVGAEIQAAVADLLGRGDLRDVFWSSLGDDAARRETQAGLDAAKGYVRREVTSRVKLRVSPEVFFVFDGSVQEGDKIDRLLREVKAKEGW